MDNRFLQFLEEISATDWEYSDGTPMAEDARKHLDTFNNITAQLTAAHHQGWEQGKFEAMTKSTGRSYDAIASMEYKGAEND